ncbi:unnamed protein product [Parnassius mnemosyne]|uniref:Uncharacterized protein n=1 Tax=Parnassius mnemosyne TaxID=213953 RepID=A0AAV1MC12_9NEOP
MEDIYDNLENYDDLNKIEELKIENKELKCKIEEYTTAICKLQENILQDFDKLAAEHKKLELNYSSLLRTAKAEIERKTQLIKDLNIEKDKLVINARLNLGQKALNKFRRSQRLQSKNKKVSDSSIPDQSVGLKSKHQIAQNKCKNDNQLPSLDTISSTSTNGKVNNDPEQYLENKSSNHDTSNLTSKENNMQMLNKPQSRKIETKLRRISNRRKSMPALSSHDIKLSSDEEIISSENIVVTKENKNYHQRNEDVVRRFGEKNYSNNNKISGPSSVENSQSHYHDALINNHSKNKTNWYYHNENHRSREFSQRQRWQSSPDRLHHRSVKDYTADNYQRCEYNRRACESPPRDKYHRNRSRDRRSNYERGYHRDFLHGKDDERNGQKHKYQDDLDEPSYKRQKLDHLHHKHSENDNRSQSMDDNRRQNVDSNRWQSVDDSRRQNVDDSRWQNLDNNRWQNVNDNRRLNLDNNRWSNIDNNRRQNMDENRWKNVDDNRRENEMEVSKGVVTKAMDLPEHVSCQSPDYVHTDYHTDAIKEIMNTAVMHLEDPRLTSKKYKVINDNDKEFISTVTGKNVNIIPIDKNLWGFEPVPVPKALLEPPTRYTTEELATTRYTTEEVAPARYTTEELAPTRYTTEEVAPTRYTTEELVKNIYMDIDNPTSNISVESGEISDTDDYIISSSNTSDHKQLEKLAKDPIVVIDNNEKLINIERNNDNNYNDISNNHSVNKSKTPKLQNISETEAKSERVVSDINSEHTAGSNSTTHRTVENGSENNNRVEIKSMPQLNISSKSTIDIKNACNTINKEKNERLDLKFATKCNDHELAVSASIVENDLVLSDDTSDIEPKSKVTKKNSKLKNKKDKIDNYTEKQKSEEVMKKCRKDHKVLTDTDNIAQNKEKPLKVNNKNKNLEISTEHGKGHRSSTRKPQVNKGSDVDTPKTSKLKKDIQEKTPKIPENKTKFSDLFGDSSSLITPDDLGIASAQNERREKYVTVFEDIEDAMDLNIKEIQKLKGSTLKTVDSQDNAEEEHEKIQTRSSKPNLDCASGKDSNSKECETQKTNKQSIKNSEEKSSTIKETSDIVNIYKNVNAETPNVVNTIIISTGIQPTALCDKSNVFTQPQNVISLENVTKPTNNLAPKALATSTPAKVAQQEQTLTDSTKIRLPPDSSSANSDDSRMVDSSQTVNDSSDLNIDPQKDIDIPDVRIFMKRRRKVKKMTP